MALRSNGTGTDDPENDPGLNGGTAQSAGLLDTLGMASTMTAKTAPGSNYKWQGASVGMMEKEQQEAKNGKASQADINAGSQYLDGDGMAAQQRRQTSLADALTLQANGEGDSAAQKQLQAGQDQNVNNLLSAARTARGPSAGTAGYQAAQAGAQSGAQVSQQAAILRAQESTQARTELANLLQQQQAANLQAAAQKQQMAMYNAGLGQQQNALNANTGLGYAGLGVQVGNGMMQGGIAQGQNQLGAQGINAQQSAANAAGMGALVGGGISAAGSMLAMSDMRAKSGIAPAGGNDEFVNENASPAPDSEYAKAQAAAAPKPTFAEALNTSQRGVSAMSEPQSYDPNGSAVASSPDAGTRAAAVERPAPTQALPAQQLVSDGTKKKDVKPAGDWTVSNPDNVVGMDYLGDDSRGALQADGRVSDQSSGRKEVSASLSGRTPKFTVGTGSDESAGYGEGEERGGGGSKPKAAASASKASAPRKMTEDELKRLGDQIRQQTEAQKTMVEHGASVNRDQVLTQQAANAASIDGGAQAPRPQLQSGAKSMGEGIAQGVHNYLAVNKAQQGQAKLAQPAGQPQPIGMSSDAAAGLFQPGGDLYHDNSQVTSDEKTKKDVKPAGKAETPAEKKAREDAEDAAEIARFNKEVPTTSAAGNEKGYEARSKAIDEERRLEAQAKAERQAPAVKYANDSDERLQSQASRLKDVPLVGAWAQGKVDERAKQTDDQKVERAVKDRQAEMEWAAKRASVDVPFERALRRLAPSVAAKADKGELPFGYRADQDSRQRQMQTFKRGDDNAIVSDEGLKKQVSPADKKALTSGKSEAQLEWERSKGNKSESGMSDEQYDANLGDDEEQVASKAASKRRGGQTVSDSFLDALAQSQSTYRYKDPSNEPTDNPTGGKYLGIMAQAVEDTPTGDTIVKEGPKGKYLEVGSALSAALAGLGRVHERLDDVEASQGKRKKRSV